jgi:diguanylate cyclase (GGDEF)-like protein
MPEEENRKDELTQLLNWRGIRAVAEAIYVFGVLVIDIDHFRVFNMDNGHRVGDVALVEFANRLTAAVGGYGEVGRTGGEVFLAVLPNATLDMACIVAERVCERVRNEPFGLPEGRASALTTSIGVACAPWMLIDNQCAHDRIRDSADAPASSNSAVSLTSSAVAAWMRAASTPMRL